MTSPVSSPREAWQFNHDPQGARAQPAASAASPAAPVAVGASATVPGPLAATPSLDIDDIVSNLNALLQVLGTVQAPASSTTPLGGIVQSLKAYNAQLAAQDAGDRRNGMDVTT